MPKLLTGQTARFSFSASQDINLDLRGAWELAGRRTELAPVSASLSLSVINETDPLASDLVRVILALHTADCAVRRPRGSRSDPVGWNRRISVRIPVRSPAVWRQATDQLAELLVWLTDDDWDVEFESYDGAPPVKQMRMHFDNDGVALFSGGLDSMAGFALDRVGGGRPVPFGISTNTRTSGLQSSALEAFRTLVGPPDLVLESAFMRVPIRYESSQRTRGLLYLGLASAVAAVYRVNVVKVYENGVGAINLPLVPSQMGTMSSRSVHPRTLLLFQDLAQRVLEYPVTYKLPFLFQTKGQMYERLVALNLGSLASVTKSCDLLPRRTKPCRMCTSCLLSRLATGDVQTPDEVEHLRGDDAVARWAMESHVAQLTGALEEAEPWNSLARRFPAIWTALESSAQLTGQPVLLVQQRIIDMYKKLVQEWVRFAAC